MRTCGRVISQPHSFRKSTILRAYFSDGMARIFGDGSEPAQRESNTGEQGRFVLDH